MADYNAKEASGLGHSRGGPGLANNMKRADTKAQRGVYNETLRFGESCHSFY